MIIRMKFSQTFEHQALWLNAKRHEPGSLFRSWGLKGSLVDIVKVTLYLKMVGKELAESFGLEKGVLAEVSIKTLSSWRSF